MQGSSGSTEFHLCFVCIYFWVVSLRQGVGVLKVLGLSDPRSKSAKELGEPDELGKLGFVTQYSSSSI